MTKKNKIQRPTTLIPVVNKTTFPPVLTEWLKTLPPDAAVREYNIAKVNLARIADHAGQYDAA